MRRGFETGLVFRPLEERDARAIQSWRYAGPYALYDSDPEDLSSMLDPEHAYHAVTSTDGELLGYCCFGADARVPGGDYSDGGALDLGGGLRPDLTGQGLGIAFLRAVLDFTGERFAPEAYRVTIAAFNRRAIRMCQWAGFEVTGRFSSGSSDDVREFVVLALKA